MTTLARRSALVLGLLFGLVFAVGIGVMWYLHQPVWFAIAFAVAVVLLQYAVAPWVIDWLFKIEWRRPESVSPEFAQWYRATCAQLKIKEPRFGVIEDGNPNAFAYGRTRGDSRVVVTSGLIGVLTPEELQAVVAHEFGHVAHRDFIVMTVAQSVPLILYILYVWTRDRARDGIYAVAVAAGAYAAYIFSQYVVLMLSRVREYFADETAGLSTRNPNALSTALVKIAYGMAPRPDKVLQAQQAEQPKDKKDKKEKKQGGFESSTAVAALGIANLSNASGFAIGSADASGAFSVEAMERAAQWDFKNPWAKWFELHSTHPLTARRVLAMNAVAERLQQTPVYRLQNASSRRVYNGNFAMEFAIYALPTVLAAGALLALRYGMDSTWLKSGGAALVGFGIGSIISTLFAYNRGQQSQVGRRNVASLVGEEIDVSPVSPVFCRVEGEIVGRGVPGLFWSDDLVLRDETGFITLQYHQPLGIMEFFFGWLKAGRYQGRQAKVYGWYRRAPVPYVEIDRVEIVNAPDDGIRCYYVWGVYAVAAIAIIAGAIMTVW